MTQRNNHYRAIVFDFGGVLVDWNPQYLYRKLMNGDDSAIEKFLNEIGFEEWNTEMDRQPSFAKGIPDLIQRFPHHADLIRAYDDRWLETIGGPIESNVHLVSHFKQAGLQLYGLSNCPYDKYLLLRSQYSFFNLLEDSVISGEVKLLKPDPRIYHLLLEKIRRPAGECVFIDDAAENVAAARDLGFSAIHYRGAVELQIELEQLGLPN
jgi:2-haloacid dehalogenase